MAIRLAETMRLKANKFNAGKPTGHIVMDTGVRDGETWGKRAKWCDYHGPVEGKIMGVAILDHPQNPRHPTWWHVRDYGLFAANPFGVHDFEKKSAGEGNLVIPATNASTMITSTPRSAPMIEPTTRSNPLRPNFLTSSVSKLANSAANTSTATKITIHATTRR